MSCSIYVGNLPYSANSDSLNEIFSTYGSVVSSRVITDTATGRSKGFGFVEMSSEEEASAAIKELDNAEVNGRNIKVNLAKPKEEKPRSSGRRDNYRQNYR
ncbi:MAG: RNA-binding protein [Spirochaetes bacterium GWD1_27_9]|nr:MAG: RNA-binding protein [Spirochaetes bacterium GWB1_27_13]OHD24662.1 MAG: RNA-binding protein [Spirochaetes bacterium GWC1_27_15]OHD45039.1 MAG: RNA-binding protein [Spirochaetes bacterium GWD1_27_9]